MKSLHYQDFDIQIDEHAAGGYRARLLASPAGQAESFFELPFSELEIENFLLRIGRPRRGVRRIYSPEMNAVQEFGSKLYDAVFQGSLQSCLQRSLDSTAQQEQGIRLRLRLPPSLIDLPWEYLYDSLHQRFLAHSTTTPIVRFLDLPHPPRPLSVSPPLNVLVMIASPSDYEPLDVEAEWQKLKRAVATLEQRGLIHLTRLPTEKQTGATLAALQKQLRHTDYHVFHFIGHGGFDQQTQEGVLVFEDDEGRSRLVSGNHLGTLLHDHPSLRLALLNACEGARATQSDPFAGVAQQLVRQGIPAVIAMQFEITDNAAILLAREFYDALANGYPVDGALAEVRKAIFTAGNDIEWGTPVLYLRASDGNLFSVAKQPSGAAPAVSNATAPANPKNTITGRSTGQMNWRRWIAVGLAGALLLAGGILLWRWQQRNNEPVAPPTTVAATATATEPSQTPQSQPVAASLSAIDAVSRTLLLNDATEARDRGDEPTAINIYNQLLAANPQDLAVLLGLARAQWSEGRNADALRTLSKAYQIAPDNPEVNYELGELYFDGFDERQLALKHFTLAIDKGATETKRDSYNYRALVYREDGKYAEAIADMDQVIKIDPNSDAYALRGEIYLLWQKEAEAEADITAAINREPNAGKYYLYRARGYAQFERVAEAVSDYSSFLKLRDPNHNQSDIDEAENYIRLYSATPSATVTSAKQADTPQSSLADATPLTNSIDGAIYVFVPAGIFTMGLDEGGFDEKPAHHVELAAFWIMQTEVTNEQYKKCVDADVCSIPFNPAWGSAEFWANYDLHPVTHITWEQAQTYAEWAEGRLPTEAEWEKAARGADGRRYPWGDTQPTSQQLNFNKQIGATQPVGSYLDGASPYGALDMAGNVWEWVADWYAEDYYQNSPSENPTGPPTGERRIWRGGAFDSSADYVGSHYREGAEITYHTDDCGFRVVRDAPPN